MIGIFGSQEVFKVSNCVSACVHITGVISGILLFVYPSRKKADQFHPIPVFGIRMDPTHLTTFLCNWIVRVEGQYSVTEKILQEPRAVRRKIGFFRKGSINGCRLNTFENMPIIC